jgi:hypothetical protein
VRRALFAGFVLLFACASPQTKRGAVFFEYDQCTIDIDDGPCIHHYESIAAGGAQQRILLRNANGCGQPNVSSVRSTDESVFTAALTASGDVLVTTGAAGAADLELLDGGGGLIDAATLRVEDVASIPPLKDPSGPVILAGNVQTLHLDRLDARGIVLIGTGGTVFSSTGPIARDADPPTSGDRFAGTPFTFHGDVGDAVLTATHGAASFTAPMHFVDTTGIAAVQIFAEQHPVVEKGTSLITVDSIGVDAAGKSIFGTRCNWSSFSGTAALYDDAELEKDELPPSFLELGGVRRDYFSGHGTATCTIAAATATVTIP